MFTCLVLFEQLSLPGWSPWPKPRYPGTQLAGRHPDSQRRSPLPRHAENTKMKVGEPYLQGCLLAVISPVLKVVPLEKKRSTMFFLCFGNSSRTSREPSPKILVRIGVEKLVMIVNRTAMPAVMMIMLIFAKFKGYKFCGWQRRR